MHITLESDYAVRIVHCLTVHQTRMDAKAIAQETGVTLRFSLKILRKLVGGGVVRSYKGTKGGYELARPAEEISLADVIETVEGPYALARCVSEEYPYNNHPNTTFCGVCQFRDIYRDISQEVRQRLSAVKFSRFIPPQ